MSIGDYKEIEFLFRIDDVAGSYSVSIGQKNLNGFDPNVVGPCNNYRIISQITIYEAFKFNSKIK